MSVTLPSLFIVCSHGRRSAHKGPGDPPIDPGLWCPGGRPVTLEDLGGEILDWCVNHDRAAIAWADESPQYCSQGFSRPPNECEFEKRILIPLPQMVAGESL